jgi:glycine/D-amino acid oxidase-like deaminating enzyme
VVGSNGKIGSFILHRLNKPIFPTAENLTYPQSLNAAAVPRGVAPGCLSPNSTPIYACIPASSIADVWHSTVPYRRRDLVFLCNCIPSRHLRLDDSISTDDITVAVLHFGVSNNSSSSESSETLTPLLSNSPSSPSTVVYGKHAQSVYNLLQRAGIHVIIVNDPHEIQFAAVRKLVWSSLMWLLCHGNNAGRGESIPVKDVHELKADKLKRLVGEMMPTLEAISSEFWSHGGSHSGDWETKPTMQSIGTVQDILDYLEQYSMSLSKGNVIPSKELAMREIRERNGVLISTLIDRKGNVGTRNEYHIELIRQVAGEDVLAKCLAQMIDQNTIDEYQRVECISSNLEFLFRSDTPVLESFNTTKSAVIIGAGMIGSSIAFHLSKRGVNVTVLDQRNNILPSVDNINELDPGTATSSSFAWLNANDKSPLSYKQFNQLGMEIWRRHDVLKQSPVWCGSLVKTRQRHRGSGDALNTNPFYLSVGPLDIREASRLEPGIQWSSEASDVHFYPEEGHVDPFAAVHALRSSAISNGAVFLESMQVNNLLRDDRDKVVGVSYTKSSDQFGKDGAELQPFWVPADVVVIAAGANSSDAILGVGPQNLKMLDQPGMLTYAVSSTMNTEESNALERIFVDTTNEVHMLRRSNNTIVIGGGQLVVGGKNDASLRDTNRQQSHSEASLSSSDHPLGRVMLEKAIEAVSSTGKDLEFVGVSRTNRPIPCDGLPAIGFSDSGLYVAVSHSGITLGPLIGELAAYEIYHEKIAANGQRRANNCDGFNILDAYRPCASRVHGIEVPHEKQR